MNDILITAIFTLIVMLISYFLGSINFSIILTKIVKKDDIRKYGSGNAGATNVLRSVGKIPALLTFVFDFIKCAVAVIVAGLIFSYTCEAFSLPVIYVGLSRQIAGLFCILGHVFPIFFGFKGGKGVVTTAAMMAIVDWRVFLLCFAFFVLLFVIKKIVSLSSIIGTATYPIFTFLVVFFIDYSSSLNSSESVIYLVSSVTISFTVALIIVLKHKSNIKRLLNGEEKPIIGKNK